MKKTKGLILSIVVVLLLVALPITVKVVLEQTVSRSRAEITDYAAHSYRVPVEAEKTGSGGNFQQTVGNYLPEIGAGVVFIWLSSMVLFFGIRKRKNERSKGADSQEAV